MKLEMAPAVPTILFETIEEDYRAKGIEITDVNGLLGSGEKSGHFERWHKAKGLPDFDSEGKHFLSSKIFFSDYQNDPEGEPAANLYVNLWHYLLQISEPFEWTETDSERRKIAPIVSGLLIVQPDLPDEDLEKARKELEAKGTLTDEMFEHYIKIRRERHKQDIEAKRLMEEVIEHYGVEVEEYGKILFIEMVVER